MSVHGARSLPNHLLAFAGGLPSDALVYIPNHSSQSYGTLFDSRQAHGLRSFIQNKILQSTVRAMHLRKLHETVNSCLKGPELTADGYKTLLTHVRNMLGKPIKFLNKTLPEALIDLNDSTQFFFSSILNACGLRLDAVPQKS